MDENSVIYQALNVNFFKFPDICLCGTCSKISNIFLFLFSNKMLVFRARTHKMLVRIANREESDLGLHCLSRYFWQATSVQNFKPSSFFDSLQKQFLTSKTIIFLQLSLLISYHVFRFWHILKGDHKVRSQDKTLYWKSVFFMSHPKHMLWVLKRTISMRQFF